MRNYKARMTSKNMEISQEDKESLIQLIIFATTLGDSIDEIEANRTINLAKDWKSKSAQDISTVENFEMLQNEHWAEQQDLSDIISIIVNILAASDFFDIQKSLMKTLKQYSTDFMKNVPGATYEEANKIKFSNSDFACQFYGDDGKGGKRKVSETEKYANLMYLTNQLSHVFSEAYNGKISGMSNYQIRHITYELRKIKDWCIHKLIEEKSKGEPIEIATAIDSNVQSSNNGIISFAIPNYLEPFIIHYNPSILSEEELKLCDGTERFRSQGLRTTFPQYLSDEKSKLLEELYAYTGSAQEGTAYIRTRKLEWLFDTKKILDSLTKKRLKNSPSTEKTTKKVVEAQIIDVQKENAETLEAIQSSLGISFPDYFKEGFLNRTSYSISQYMQTVSSDVKEALIRKGVPQEEVDKEFAKLVVYMKMVKPLSVISQKSKEEKISQALECLEEYGPIYDVIINNLQDKKTYSELRSQIRKQANQIAINKQRTKTNQPEIDDEIVGEETIDQVELPDDVEVISLPVETVQELQDEIVSLTQEISDLTTVISQASKKLTFLQSKVIQIQRQIQNAMHSGNVTNEEKGDR